MSGHQSSERTPLLRQTSGSHGNGSAIQDDDIQAAEVVGQGALDAPKFPDLGKRGSSSHSQRSAPDEDAAARPEPEDLSNFGADGLLAGVTRTRFRFIFGGILGGYFVSSTQGNIHRELLITQLQIDVS
jgi:hypothetical protein